MRISILDILLIIFFLFRFLIIHKIDYFLYANGRSTRKKKKKFDQLDNHKGNSLAGTMMSVELYQLHSMHSIVSLYSTRNNRSANVVNQIFLGTEYARQNWIEKTNESAMHADGSHGHNPICVVTMSTGI